MNVNEIYLGDAYELIKQIPDKSIDLIVTDPPYLIEDLHISNTPFGSRQYINEMKDANLGGSIDMAKMLPEFVRVMKRINLYIWCNKEQIYDYLTFFHKERGCNWEMIVWAKTNPSPYCSTHYLKDKEYCLYFWETGVQVKPTFHTGKTVYITVANQADKSDYGHPTIKPIEIITNLIRNSSGGGV